MSMLASTWPLVDRAVADITCLDFDSQAEAQEVFDALPGDPYGIDSGWPVPEGFGFGDQEAGNGVACDATNDVPETDSPGNEEYRISSDSSKNGLEALPVGDLEEATVKEVQYAEAIQTEENPSKFYVIMGIATPEYQIYSNYETGEVPGQCGAAAATERLRQLLSPGTKIWLQIDEAGFYARDQLDRQIWVKVGPMYRLVSEVLVSEGHAVVATDRPGTGIADAKENPPPGAMYRDALRTAQRLAIKYRRGIWEACSGG